MENIKTATAAFVKDLKEAGYDFSEHEKHMAVIDKAHPWYKELDERGFYAGYMPENNLVVVIPEKWAELSAQMNIKQDTPAYKLEIAALIKHELTHVEQAMRCSSIKELADRYAQDSAYRVECECEAYAVQLSFALEQYNRVYGVTYTEEERQEYLVNFFANILEQFKVCYGFEGTVEELVNTAKKYYK